MEDVKTLDKQTAAFLGAVAQQMPPLSAKEMQRYIEKPNELAGILLMAFLPKFEVWRTVTLGGQKLDLTIVSVTNLFLKNIRDCSEIYKRAEDVGLRLCPAELPYQVAKTNDELNEECLFFATNPIEKHNAFLGTRDRVLLVMKGRKIEESCSRYNRTFFNGRTKFIFVLPRR